MKVRLGEIEVGYTEAGSGPPVVLLHGLAQDRASWADVQARLPEFRTFACDLRGHGETTLGVPEGTLAQLGRDLDAFLEAVTGPARCVGYSLGGTVVLAAAAGRPDLVTGAVVAGTSTVVGSVAAGFFAERIALAEHDFAALTAALPEDTAAQLVTGHADREVLAAARIAAIGTGAGYVNAARAMIRLAEEPLTPALASIGVPVDLIGGDGDAFCPRRAADIMLAALADGVYREIADAGHLMGEDQPAAYAEAIRAALQRRAT